MRSRSLSRLWILLWLLAAPVGAIDEPPSEPRFEEPEPVVPPPTPVEEDPTDLPPSDPESCFHRNIAFLHGTVGCLEGAAFRCESGDWISLEQPCDVPR